MATGKIIKDYAPLMRFLKLIPCNARQDILPQSEDLLRLKRLVKGGTDVNELLKALARTFSRRLAPYGKEASEVLKNVWGIDASEEYAVEELSRELAGWVIEIGEGLGYLSIRVGKQVCD